MEVSKWLFQLQHLTEYFHFALLKISESSTSEIDCPNIISRQRWGARAAKSVTYQTFPVKNVIIHHTVTQSCNTKLKCSNILLGIQNYLMDQQGGDDIPYK